MAIVEIQHVASERRSTHDLAIAQRCCPTLSLSAASAIAWPNHAEGDRAEAFLKAEDLEEESASAQESACWITLPALRLAFGGSRARPELTYASSR